MPRHDYTKGLFSITPRTNQGVIGQLIDARDSLKVTMDDGPEKTEILAELKSTIKKLKTIVAYNDWA